MPSRSRLDESAAHRIELKPSDWLSPEHLSREIGVSVSTLRDWRVRKRGPSYLKVAGNRIWYPRDLVEHWLQNQLKQPDSGFRPIPPTPAVIPALPGIQTNNHRFGRLRTQSDRMLLEKNGN